MDKLNLGCSIFKKRGFLNVDIDFTRKPDILYDLNKIPYSLKELSFSVIEADHILEHLESPFSVMKELHRLLKPKGQLIIRVPHFSRGFTHPDHKAGFDVSFPLYFNKCYKAFYCGVPFKLEKMRLVWFAQPYMKKITLNKVHYFAGTILGKIINIIANRSPYFCSRVWCFLVGGFEEIEFRFSKIDYEK